MVYADRGPRMAPLLNTSQSGVGREGHDPSGAESRAPMRNAATPRRRPGRRGALADQRGAAALEFALTVPIFFILLFSIIEAGLYFFTVSAVDAASTKASRLIRTGQAQNGVSREAFFDKVCEVVDLFGDCKKTLTVDVTRFNDFATLAGDLSAPVCRDSDPNIADPDDRPYEIGARRDIIRVRVCYLYDSFNPFLGLKLDKTPDGANKIIATTVFRNEEF